jgi:hypothetical protein
VFDARPTPGGPQFFGNLRHIFIDSLLSPHLARPPCKKWCKIRFRLSCPSYSTNGSKFIRVRDRDSALVSPPLFAHSSLAVGPTLIKC